MVKQYTIREPLLKLECTLGEGWLQRILKLRISGIVGHP